jgi:hypothetical protein
MAPTRKQPRGRDAAKPVVRAEGSASARAAVQHTDTAGQNNRKAQNASFAKAKRAARAVTALLDAAPRG